jgi:hypothetical protein
MLLEGRRSAYWQFYLITFAKKLRVATLCVIPKRSCSFVHLRARDGSPPQLAAVQHYAATA